jgi:hypothetical protein
MKDPKTMIKLKVINTRTHAMQDYNWLTEIFIFLNFVF